MWGRSASHAASSGQDWSLKRTIINVDERWQKKTREEMKWKLKGLLFTSTSFFFLFHLLHFVVFTHRAFPSLRSPSSAVRPRHTTVWDSFYLAHASRERASESWTSQASSSLQPWPASTPKRVVGTSKKTDDYLPFVIKQILKIVDCCRAYE